jgi:hypothetical protein
MLWTETFSEQKRFGFFTVGESSFAGFFPPSASGWFSLEPRGHGHSASHRQHPRCAQEGLVRPNTAAGGGTQQQAAGRHPLMALTVAWQLYLQIWMHFSTREA